MLERAQIRIAIGALGVFLAVIGVVGIRSCVRQHQVSAASEQVDRHHESSSSHAAKGEVHDQQAEAQNPKLQADALTVAALRTEVDRLRKAAGRPASPPSVPNAPEPQPVAPPVDLGSLVAKQDDLIKALTQENEDLKTQNHTLVLARDEHRESAREAQAEAKALRTALEAKTQLVKAWAAGVSYGTDGQAGAWAERDLGPIRVGIDVIRRKVAGGNSTLEAVARVGVRW